MRKQNRFIPNSKFKFFRLQCFSNMAGQFVDHLQPVGPFEELVAKAENMRECKSRVGISIDNKVWAFPKGLHFEPQR